MHDDQPTSGMTGESSNSTVGEMDSLSDELTGKPPAPQGVTPDDPTSDTVNPIQDISVVAATDAEPTESQPTSHDDVTESASSDQETSPEPVASVPVTTQETTDEPVAPVPSSEQETSTQPVGVAPICDVIDSPTVPQALAPSEAAAEAGQRMEGEPESQPTQPSVVTATSAAATSNADDQSTPAPTSTAPADQPSPAPVPAETTTTPAQVSAEIPPADQPSPTPVSPEATTAPGETGGPTPVPLHGETPAAAGRLQTPPAATPPPARPMRPAPLPPTRSISDLKPGDQLIGRVRGLSDFGAFVDLGLRERKDGLIHISQLADRRIGHPSEVVSIGDDVTVWVLTVDIERGRISLTMRDPSVARPAPPRRDFNRRPPAEGGETPAGTTYQQRPFRPPAQPGPRPAAPPPPPQRAPEPRPAPPEEDEYADAPDAEVSLDTLLERFGRRHEPAPPDPARQSRRGDRDRARREEILKRMRREQSEYGDE